MSQQPEWMNFSDEVIAATAAANPSWKRSATTGAPLREATPNASRTAGTPERKRRYAEDALAKDCAELAAMGPESGRNNELNRIAFKQCRFVHWSWIDQATVYTALRDAYRACGGIRDHTEGQFIKTFNGALESSKRLPEPEVDWHTGPAPHVEIVTNIDGFCFDANDCPITPDEYRELIVDEVAAQLQDDVVKRAYQLRVSDHAQRLYNSEKAAEMGQERPPVQSLTDMLLIPDEDATYRIARLLPTGGRALLAAPYKVGKTSLMANLIKALVDNHEFLGRFEVQPTARIALIDTELDERMLRRWLREVGMVRTDKVNVLALRGKLSTFNILDDAVRAAWAAELNGADFVILDCLRPCLDALGLDENRDAGRFLVAFDELIKECGASEAVMVHHMGHQDNDDNGGKKERGRGDSRLMDWPDVNWKIVRNNNDESDDTRYFSANGRDVNVEESKLIWNSQDRSLFLGNGGRTQHSAENYTLPDIVGYLRKSENVNGAGQNAIENAMKPLGHGRNQVRLALRGATQTGALVVGEGPNNRKLYTVNPSYREEEIDE